MKNSHANLNTQGLKENELPGSSVRPTLKPLGLGLPEFALCRFDDFVASVREISPLVYVGEGLIGGIWNPWKQRV